MVKSKEKKLKKLGEIVKDIERRRWPRLEKRFPVKILRARPPRFKGEKGFSIDAVWTRDLCGAGLGLTAPINCPINSLLDVSFGFPGRTGPIKATVAVVYSKPEPDQPGHYRLGVSYKKIKEEERQAIIYYISDHLR